MIHLMAAWLRAKRRLAEHQHRPLRPQTPMWRLLLGEVGYLAAKLRERLGAGGGEEEDGDA